jgi:hypothetical protein
MSADRAVTSLWLSVAGILSFGSAGAVFLREPRAITGAYLLIMTLISIAAARGSRMGWGLLLLIAITVLVEFVLSEQSGFRAAVWGGIALALLTPASLRFVWQGPRRAPFSRLPIVSRYWMAARVALYGAIGLLAQGESGEVKEGAVHRRSFSVWLWRLGYGSAALFFIYVLAFNIQSGDHGNGVSVVDVVVAISRAGFVICALLFLGTAFAAIHARLRRTGHSQKSESRP